MNLYTVLVSGKGSPTVVSGLTGIPQSDGTIILDDSLIPVVLSQENDLTEFVKDHQKLIVVMDGFLNIRSGEIQADRTPDQNQGTIIVHFKVRIESRSLPICEVFPVNISHKPLIRGFKNDLNKSIIFAIKEGDGIRLKMGRSEYLFEVKDNLLQMHDLTNPVWPPMIRPRLPDSSSRPWWTRIFRHNRRPPSSTSSRVVHFVDCR